MMNNDHGHEAIIIELESKIPARFQEIQKPWDKLWIQCDWMAHTEIESSHYNYSSSDKMSPGSWA